MIKSFVSFGRNRLILCFFATILFSILLNGQDSWSGVLTEANGLFAQKRYKDALEKYQSLEMQDLESAELYGCMGNAYMAIDSLSAAILYYERALLLAPRNSNLRYNLAIANSRIEAPIEALPLFWGLGGAGGVATWFGADMWGVLSLVVVWLSAVCTLFFMYRRTDRFRKWYFWAAAFLLLLGLLMTLWGKNRLVQEKERKRGVLMPQYVSVKDKASLLGAEMIQAPSGTVVKILENDSNGWVKIKLPDGNEGWVTALEVGVI